MQQIQSYFDIHYPEADIRHLAYILATADYETGRTFLPIEDETRGKGTLYATMTKTNGKPYLKPMQLYYRRGIVPLVGYENYRKISRKSGINILENPSLIMTQEIAVMVLVDSMMHGWYTGRKLSDYFHTKKADWEGARAIVQKGEKNILIGALARDYWYPKLLDSSIR